MVEPENTSVLAQKEPQHYDFYPKSLFSTLIGTAHSSFLFYCSKDKQRWQFFFSFFLFLVI
jgi:hypothetical protein